MDLILKNDYLGQEVKLSTKPAWFWLLNGIPPILPLLSLVSFLGSIVVIYFAITKKQFKLWASYILVNMILTLLIAVIGFVLGAILIPSFGTQGAIIAIFVMGISSITINFYVLLKIATESCYWQYNNYINVGYHLVYPNNFKSASKEVIEPQEELETEELEARKEELKTEESEEPEIEQFIEMAKIKQKPFWILLV